MSVSSACESAGGEGRRRKFEDSSDEDDESSAASHHLKSMVPGLNGNDVATHTPSPGPRKSLHRVQQLQLEQLLDEGSRRDMASEANFTQTMLLAKGLEDTISLDPAKSATKRRRLDEPQPPFTPPVSSGSLGSTTPVGRRPPTQRRHSVGALSSSPIASSVRRAAWGVSSSRNSPLSPRRPARSVLVEQLKGMLPHLQASGSSRSLSACEPGSCSPGSSFEFRPIPRAPMFFNPPSRLSQLSLDPLDPPSNLSEVDSPLATTPMMEIDVIADLVSSPTPCRTPRTTPVPSPVPSDSSDINAKLQ